MMDDIKTQIVAMNAFVAMAMSSDYNEHDRCSYLTMAFMHACVAATLIEEHKADTYGFKLDDCKHEIRDRIINLMLGIPFDKALIGLKEFVA